MLCARAARPLMLCSLLMKAYMMIGLRERAPGLSVVCQALPLSAWEEGRDHHTKPSTIGR